MQRRADLLIVTAKSAPDLDGVACAVACAELLRRTGSNAVALVDGQPDAEARYVLERCGAVPLASAEEARAASGFVLVDASDLAGMPGCVTRERVVEVIDHRMHHRAGELFTAARLQIEPVGAAATLIEERFEQEGVEPSAAAAVLLYGAICSNTQRLRGSVTTDRDRRAASVLEATGAIPAGLVEGQFMARRGAILSDLPAAIDQEQKEFVHASGPYVISQLELPGGAELVADQLPQLMEALARLGPRAMLNVVDSTDARSLLVVPDERLRSIVAARLGVRFDGPVAESGSAVLRKQIVAALSSAP